MKANKNVFAKKVFKVYIFLLDYIMHENEEFCF